MSVTGCTIQFWREEMGHSEILPCAGYNGLQKVPNRHPDFPNFRSDHPRISHFETVRDDEHLVLCREVVESSGQKGFTIMIESLKKVSKLRQSVLYPLLYAAGFQ